MAVSRYPQGLLGGGYNDPWEHEMRQREYERYAAAQMQQGASSKPAKPKEPEDNPVLLLLVPPSTPSQR